MTTISNQNSLIDPLARTKGGCANNNSTKNDPPPRKEVVEEGYDGVMPLLGIKQEFDEEIASVEADGMGDGGQQHSGGFSQSRNVEKKILTAALVNSMAEAPRSAIAHPNSDGDTKQRSVRTPSVQRQAVKTEDHNSIPYPGGGASHVTPTTSEASSFSSVETADHESKLSNSSVQGFNQIPQLQSRGTQFPKAPNPLPSNPYSRTIYPRASKAAANTKVATALNHPGGNSPRGKRKIDAVKTAATQPTGKQMYHPPSQSFNSTSSSVPNPLAGMDTPSAKMPPPQPQVSFQYTHYPLSKSDPAASSSNGNNSFSEIAESMLSQKFKYQADNLMSSSANELMSSQQQQPQQGRGRIFSIDLDPSVLDFVESVVDPLGNSDDAPQGRSRNYSVTFDDDVNSNSGRLSFRRDRGFSFEFFSFGIDGDEPLPSIEENSTTANKDPNNGNRIRGDSIIFDPISFHDGGIHETSALMHVKHESRDNVQEYAVSAPAAAAAAPQAHYTAPPSIIHNPPQGMRPSMPPHCGPQSLPSKPSAQAKPKTSDKPKRSKAKSSQIHVPSTSTCRQITITTSSSSRNCPQSFSDNTIHMPHGSDAAAAAAAGMTQPSSTSSEGFGGISHTSCPMELLNKGGRIGIYLPEERKARIAKFHDKRKQRMWRKKIKYDCRKKLADSRPRIKGRFVKRSDVDGE